MFIFYYAVLSEVSPPTALSAFAAAAITGGDGFRTMMLTWRYTLPAFLVPFAFVLSPNGEGLLLQGGLDTILLAIGVSALAVAALAGALGGWLSGPAGAARARAGGCRRGRAALPRAALDRHRRGAAGGRGDRSPRAAAARDRVNVDAALARRLVAAQFPQWADLEIEPVELDGWDNRTFRLGTELTVRLPSAEWYALQVEKEQRWLPVLAPALPLPIPVPVAKGVPGEGYPFPWSVYRWLEGEVSNEAHDRRPGRVRARPGRVPGRAAGRRRHGRAGAREAQLLPRGRRWRCTSEEALQRDRTCSGRGSRTSRTSGRTRWPRAGSGEPVWFHGDVAVGNLLVRDGRLAAVIDFGSSGVGDPACDVVIAWTLFEGESREAFRETLGVDAARGHAGAAGRCGRRRSRWPAICERGSPLSARPLRDIERLVAD